MADDLEEDYYGFDETVLPDGVYRFRLRRPTARPTPTATRWWPSEMSEPVVVDHTPPRLRACAARRTPPVQVEVEDALEPAARGDGVVDGGEWRPADAGGRPARRPARDAAPGRAPGRRAAGAAAGRPTPLQRA